jgi:hypothetical protein
VGGSRAASTAGTCGRCATLEAEAAGLWRTLAAQAKHYQQTSGERAAAQRRPAAARQQPEAVGQPGGDLVGGQHPRPRRGQLGRGRSREAAGGPAVGAL